MVMLKEFERRFCELTGEDRGAVRYAARMMQLEGALPTGKRGGRNAPHLTIEHAAAFALGYYGAAMPKNAGKAAAALSSLRAAVKGPTLLDDFIELIKAHARLDGRLEDVAVTLVFFSQWAEWPTVKIYWRKLSERDAWDDQPPYESEYLLPHDAPKTKPGQKNTAVEVNGGLFTVLAGALGLTVGDVDG